MNAPIFDFEVVFFVSTVFIQFFLLWIFYLLISGRSYRHPWRIFVYGIACMFFAGFQKSLIFEIVAKLSKLNSQNPQITTFIESLPKSITVVEIATAAVGGSLVAASIVLNAQIQHNKEKILKRARLQELVENSANLEAEINMQSRLLKMESLGYTEFNKAIHGMKKDIARLQKDRLLVDSKLIEAQESFDKLKHI